MAQNTILILYIIFVIMELTKEQFAKISCYLSRQRGNVRIDNHQFVNAILYIAENGCILTAAVH
jgi:hypothetical protein